MYVTVELGVDSVWKIC